MILVFPQSKTPLILFSWPYHGFPLVRCSFLYEWALHLIVIFLFPLEPVAIFSILKCFLKVVDYFWATYANSLPVSSTSRAIYPVTMKTKWSEMYFLFFWAIFKQPLTDCLYKCNILVGLIFLPLISALLVFQSSNTSFYEGNFIVSFWNPIPDIIDSFLFSKWNSW